MNKQFLDAVHGYISVPEEICDALIDTCYFQRLRRIEQTSSRSLFPCAHHDRFVHSLGVFHIGQKILSVIEKQIPDLQPGLKQSYLIACLLHDCGHSPFSHTFEDEFGEIEDLFKYYIEEARIQEDDPEIKGVKPDTLDAKPHEIISAYLCATELYSKIVGLGGSPSLVGRMIMGISYKSDNKSLENCFISLLHGNVVDADRLDYVCRDQWALGYMSYSVDVDRLINAITLQKDKETGSYEIVYRKNALTEIQAVIDSKNFQKTQIFMHHQVQYEQHLLKKSVDKLMTTLLGDQPDTSRLFNFKAFTSPQQVVEGTDIYLLADDDLVHLMKKHIEKFPPFVEWLSREYEMVPLWKSRSEFIVLFQEEGGKELLHNHDRLFEDTVKIVVENIVGAPCLILNGTPKLDSIVEGDVKVNFGETIVDYSILDLPRMTDVYQNQVFKYVYIPKKASKKRKKILEEIRKAFKKLPKRQKSKKKQIIRKSVAKGQTRRWVNSPAGKTTSTLARHRLKSPTPK